MPTYGALKQHTLLIKGDVAPKSAKRESIFPPSRRVAACMHIFFLQKFTFIYTAFNQSFTRGIHARVHGMLLAFGAEVPLCKGRRLTPNSQVIFVIRLQLRGIMTSLAASQPPASKTRSWVCQQPTLGIQTLFLAPVSRG